VTGAAKRRRKYQGSVGWPFGFAFSVGEAIDVVGVAATADRAATDSVDVTPVCMEPALRRFVVSVVTPLVWSAMAAMATTAQPPTNDAATRMRTAGRVDSS
jgi:hypothetical protein